MEPEDVALDTGLGREIGEALELGDKLRPAVGIARIIERIDADVDVARAVRFGEPEREAEEDRVARRNVGDRYSLAQAVLRDRDVAGQRRPSKGAKIERQDHMTVSQL